MFLCKKAKSWHSTNCNWTSSAKGLEILNLKAHILLYIIQYPNMGQPSTQMAPIHNFIFLENTEVVLNLLKPNDIYICRTAALTSRRYILNIYSTNIHTEYFKRAA